MTQDKSNHDMSIEEILRSIKGVIKNRIDGTKKNNDDDEILELTDTVNIKEQEVYIQDKIKCDTDTTSNNIKNLHVTCQQEVASNDYKENNKDHIIDQPIEFSDDNNSTEKSDILEPNLISTKSATETTNILQQFADNAKEIVTDVTKSKVTLEDLVIEMIRPQLSQWLDENLPSLVRQLVEKEIKRLVPK